MLMRNTNPMMPWNNSMEKNDPFAPWNRWEHRNDPTAPWNNPAATERDYERYKRENGI